MLLNKPFITAKTNILLSWWCFCVSLQADRRRKNTQSLWKTVKLGRDVPFFNWELIQRSHSIKRATILEHYFLKMNKYDHSTHSLVTSTSWLLDICRHCFLNVAALLHCPLGSAPIWGSIMLLPVADISTGWILLLYSLNITRRSTAHVSLSQAWQWLFYSSQRTREKAEWEWE